MKISRKELVDYVESNNPKWIGSEASGTGYDWDMLVFENEDNDHELVVNHYSEEGLFYVDQLEIKTVEELLSVLKDVDLLETFSLQEKCTWINKQSELAMKLYKESQNK